MDVPGEAKRFERRVPRLPFPFDRRVFGDVLFGQGKFAQRDPGRESGEQGKHFLFHVRSHIAFNPAFRRLLRLRSFVCLGNQGLHQSCCQMENPTGHRIA